MAGGGGEGGASGGGGFGGTIGGARGGGEGEEGGGSHCGQQSLSAQKSEKCKNCGKRPNASFAREGGTLFALKSKVATSANAFMDDGSDESSKSTPTTAVPHSFQ